MNDRYKQLFNRLKSEGKSAFVPFTVLGFPDRERCLASIKQMIDAGASALELGLAFSDPVADGPVIQEAAFDTIAAGFELKDALQLLQEIRAYNRQIPIGLLVYYNIVLRAGVQQFYEQAARAGVDSVLIADLPPEAAAEVVPSAQAAGIAAVFIISPLTTDSRLEMIGRLCQGYVYVVSRLGITGTEERYDDKLKHLLARARQKIDLPLLVGFGISSAEQASSMVALGADGVISGSKVVQIIKGDNEHMTALSAYVKTMTNLPQQVEA